MSYRRRKQYYCLLILMIFASFAEMISIGMVFPFLGAITSPDRVFSHSLVQPILKVFEVADASSIVLPLTIIFCLVTLLACTLRLMLQWFNLRLAFSTGADLGIAIYRRTLYQPYSLHCMRNSSEVIDGISGKADSVIYMTIFPTLTLISSCFMLLTIFVALVTIDLGITLISFGAFGSMYVALTLVTRKKILINSINIAKESTFVIKALQEGLGGIRDVLIDGSQETFSQIYRRADLKLRRAQANSSFISVSPKYGIEALGIIFIALLAYFLFQEEGDITEYIPILGALAIGAQRLLPSLQQAYAAWTTIRTGQISLEDTLKLLDQPLPNYAVKLESGAISFERDITLSGVGFRYSPQTPYVLNQVNLSILKGSRIGFIGTTGSGKSTLLDIIMGLLSPTDGTLKVDGVSITSENVRAWQMHISHVPQTIFLADCSIEENIAFGVPKYEIDHKRVYEAAEKAKIKNVIEALPDKYNTLVGERGIRLSGGQRQRIGIARALYKKSNIIIFDEATSALDNETEQDVMHAIEELASDLTVLIIAHRITTLKNCNEIIELAEGAIIRKGSYKDVIPSIPQN